MENASKALLMAGGVLIGILILTLAVYLFVTFGAESYEMHKRIDEKQLAQFNAQFTKYVGANEVTIHDIITLLHLARDNNKKNESTPEYKISIRCNINGFGWVTEEVTTAKENEILKSLGAIDAVDSEGKNKHLFKCNSVEYKGPKGRISFMQFSEK